MWFLMPSMHAHEEKGYCLLNSYECLLLSIIIWLFDKTHLVGSLIEKCTLCHPSNCVPVIYWEHILYKVLNYWNNFFLKRFLYVKLSTYYAINHSNIYETLLFVMQSLINYYVLLLLFIAANFSAKCILAFVLFKSLNKFFSKVLYIQVI